jgi:hypothetical protein
MERSAKSLSLPQVGSTPIERMPRSPGTLTTQAEDRGTFILEGGRVILRPNQGSTRSFRWRIGTHVTALPGEPVLYLSEERGGPERMLYRK